MDAAFLKLIELSITGSLFVLAVVLLRLVFQKAPKWVFCLLWGMVALRLVLPFSIESGFSLIPENVTEKQIASQMAQSYVGDVTYIYEGSEDYQAAVDAGRKPIQSVDKNYVVTQKDSLEEPKTIKTAVLPVLSRIWIVGMVIMLGYTLISYFALRRKVSAATMLHGNIKQSECVDSPFVLGFFRPVIYLPYGITGADMENVIAHELAHIQRKDHWWKPIGFLILSVYWFHPVMWLAYILLCRDIEGACDEKVIKNLDRDGIRAYSTALLNCSIHRRSIAACPLAFGEVGVKERIKRVMHYKKPAFWIVLLVLMASVVAAVLLLTSPKEDQQLLMGAYYRAAELLYTNKQEETEVFSRFCITADYKLLAQRQGYNAWTLNRQMEQYPLTVEELVACTDYDSGWHRPYKITKIEDAYILPVENNYFYLVAKTESGDTLLGFGGADSTGNPGDSSLRYLYRLESEFEPEEVDLDFLAQSLLSEAGTVNIIEVWDSEENPGFLVAGLVSGYQYSAAGDYDDMGYAVFQTDGTGYRLLECKMYEDVLYKENRIFVCPDPVVLSLDGEMEETVTFDLILSWNENLDKIQREYYKGDELIHSVASMQVGKSSMHLFRWDAASRADRVTQVFLGKDGKELPVKTTEETILELVNRIASNPSMAASSNPYDFIKANQELFNQILSYGDTAVNYMVDYLYTSMEDGLKEYIMAAACAEITGIGKDKGIFHWFSGKHWLNLYDGRYESIIVGRPEDETGSIQVDSLLGIDCVWVKVARIEDHPYKQGVHRYSYHFYYFGDGKKYDSGQQEQYLLWIENCLEYRMGDFDNDGIVELFVYTDAADMPYELYDLNGTEIVVERFSLVPDMVLNYEMLLDSEGYYLYEERWAWFLKDPAGYVAEVAKRPEDRLYFICPSGIIPEKFDHALIENAYQKLSDWLSSPRTTYEKQIGYKIMTAMEYTYVPEMIPGQINYTMLFEKWGFTAMPSTEEQNCYNQILACFEADPVGFLRGMTEPAGATWCKDLFFVAAELARINCLYDRSAYEQVLNRLENVASTDEEKASVELLRECYETWESPNLDANTLPNCSGTELWNAFFYDPVTTLNVLGNCKEEQLKHLGQKLWDSAYWAQKLLDKGYDAVNGILDGNPTGALKDVAYIFLVHLEWEGGYSQAYIPGYPFDYQRLFEKSAYADGAMATMCFDQMYDVFEADPESFMTALAKGEWDMENIALHFAHQYQGDEKYPEILEELLKNASLKDCVQVFIEAYGNN